MVDIRLYCFRKAPSGSYEEAGWKWSKIGTFGDKLNSIFKCVMEKAEPSVPGEEV